ncbi:MAG: hypothetical protein II103_02765 [Treponema sp.]|nr:hypothetical protein [Treponema sp.]MBQ1590779.1 hypothetical protein [Treponema sp.]MBQ1643434.1 hypothetical protein [Treponema sp.]MBQ1670196.1 hypothetical protein [Treponema sp.]MBQ1726263.1 hypothetical protein [Treponema sp.]
MKTLTSFLINRLKRKSEGHIIILTLIILCSLSFVCAGICACVNAQYNSALRQKYEFYSYVEKENKAAKGSIK